MKFPVEAITGLLNDFVDQEAVKTQKLLDNALKENEIYKQGTRSAQELQRVNDELQVEKLNVDRLNCALRSLQWEQENLREKFGKLSEVNEKMVEDNKQLERDKAFMLQQRRVAFNYVQMGLAQAMKSWEWPHPSPDKSPERQPAGILNGSGTMDNAGAPADPLQSETAKENKHVVHNEVIPRAAKKPSGSSPPICLSDDSDSEAASAGKREKRPRSPRHDKDPLLHKRFRPGAGSPPSTFKDYYLPLAMFCGNPTNSPSQTISTNAKPPFPALLQTPTTVESEGATSQPLASTPQVSDGITWNANSSTMFKAALQQVNKKAGRPPEPRAIGDWLAKTLNLPLDALVRGVEKEGNDREQLVRQVDSLGSIMAWPTLLSPLHFKRRKSTEYCIEIINSSIGRAGILPAQANESSGLGKDKNMGYFKAVVTSRVVGQAFRHAQKGLQELGRPTPKPKRPLRSARSK